jgi:hypothetical protein
MRKRIPPAQRAASQQQRSNGASKPDLREPAQERNAQAEQQSILRSSVQLQTAAGLAHVDGHNLAFCLLHRVVDSQPRHH